MDNGRYLGRAADYIHLRDSYTRPAILGGPALGFSRVDGFSKHRCRPTGQGCAGGCRVREGILCNASHGNFLGQNLEDIWRPVANGYSAAEG